MKRIDNIYGQIISVDNLRLAHYNARKGKAYYRDVKKVNENEVLYINSLHKLLKNKQFKNSEYEIFERTFGQKTRTIYKLPYYPDRIIHHAILQILEPVWKKIFIRDTYQSIRGRGVHDALHRIERVLRKEKPLYCLKIDVHHFYPSVDNEIMKQIIRKKIKCNDTLYLLDEIIDSTKGLPIGNYLSQYLGNLYLAYFDHFIKQTYHLKYYYRYCDDIVIMHDDKRYLHIVLLAIKTYLNDHLKLSLNSNYQVFQIGSRPIDFLGYKFYHTHTLIRNSIKKSFIKKARSYNKKPSESKQRSLSSLYGWISHANGHNLLTKHLGKEYENIICSSKAAV